MGQDSALLSLHCAATFAVVFYKRENNILFLKSEGYRPLWKSRRISGRIYLKFRSPG
jgi:hypothetical protein